MSVIEILRQRSVEDQPDCSAFIDLPLFPFEGLMSSRTNSPLMQ
jgi:hypothetical protein